MTDTTTTPATGWRQLEYLPVGLFGSVMGLTGLSVAWRLAQARYGAPAWAADASGAVAVAAFVAVTLGYAVKLVTAPDAVRAEFHHPIAGNLFGTVLISLLLLPIILASVSLLLAQVMWGVGAVGMLVFAWLIVSRWMSDRQQIPHATPAWIIPVVGMLDVPLALPSLGLPPMHGVMVLGLAVGLFFAIPLFTLVFSRLVFEPPMPDALQPSLLILVALDHRPTGATVRAGDQPPDHYGRRGAHPGQPRHCRLASVPGIGGDLVPRWDQRNRRAAIPSSGPGRLSRPLLPKSWLAPG